MDINAPQALQSILISAGSLVIGYLLKTLIETYKEEKNDTKQEMKDLTKSLQESTIAITELKVEMRNVKDSLYMIQKLKIDVDALGSKVRDMSKN